MVGVGVGVSVGVGVNVGVGGGSTRKVRVPASAPDTFSHFPSTISSTHTFQR